MTSKGALAMPGYIQCIQDIYSSLNQYLEQEADANYTFPGGFVDDLRRYGEFSRREVAVVAVLSLTMTLLRIVLTRSVFKPMARYFGMTASNERKLPESLWKGMYNLFTWGFSCYLLVISAKYDYLYKPYAIWDDWRPAMEVPLDIYILYMTQLSFYTHSLYTTVYMDSWRKDSLVMIFHHLVSIALSSFSYATRYHKIGLLVIFMHDICDIFLEFTKVNVYLKHRFGRVHSVHEKISTVGFVCFATIWFVFRLWLFPLIVIHSAAWATVAVGPKPMVPFYLFFNAQLLIILSLNFYWFLYIVHFMVKVVTGQLQELDDVREDEVIAKMSAQAKLLRNGNGHHSNGHAPIDAATANSGAVTNGVSTKRRGKARQRAE